MSPGRAQPASPWPALPPLGDWEDTCITLHMWTQVVGKIRLELAPWINHSWGAALYVTTRGLTTSPIPHGSRAFSIGFDFVHHGLHISTTDDSQYSFPLGPMSVAEFYQRTMEGLGQLGIEVKIFPRPVEVAEAIPFDQDRERGDYDAAAVGNYWRALVQVNRVFTAFRSRFIGKVSPVHFFWGAFDLAVTRFSGRTAPKHPGGAPNCADWVMQEAYSHEVSSAGFWPGPGFGEAAFYAYAYPAPDGFKDYPVAPDAAYYHDTLGEFVLPYSAVQTAANPDAALLAFLQTTYEAAAELADWNRASLEQSRKPGGQTPG